MPLLSIPSPPPPHLHFRQKLKLPPRSKLDTGLKRIVTWLGSLRIFRRTDRKRYLPRSGLASICVPYLNCIPDVNEAGGTTPASSKSGSAFSGYKGKKALLVACTYADCEDPSMLLANSWKDTENLKKLLSKNGWKEEDIVILVDRGPNKDNYPTRANIIREMKALVDGACAGDFLVMHFSGHGGQMEAVEDKYESDGMDEFIYPCDCFELAKKKDEDGNVVWSVIIDDIFREILVDKLPLGCKLLGLIDCCSSGTMFDLPNESPIEDDSESCSPGTICMPMVYELARSPNVMGPSDFLDPSRYGDDSKIRNPTAPRRSFRPPRREWTHPPLTRAHQRRKSTLDPLRFGRNSASSQFPRFLPRRISHATNESRDDIDAHNADAANKVDPRIIRGDVMCISSCADSAQAYETDGGGTLIQAFCKIMEPQDLITIGELFISLKSHVMQQHESARRSQKDFDPNSKVPIPQCTSSRIVIDKDAPFRLS